MSNNKMHILPGTLYLDAVPIYESGRLVKYIMTAYSSSVKNQVYPVRLIANGVSNRADELVEYPDSEFDCKLSIILNGELFDDVKLSPSLQSINFKENSKTHINFNTNGYYIISLYSDKTATLLPLSNVSEIRNTKSNYVFSKDITISGIQNSFKELSDIVDDISSQVSSFVKTDANGNIVISGNSIANNFISGDVNLLDVASSLSNIVDEYNQHVLSYAQTAQLVTDIRNKVVEIDTELQSALFKNDDGSITVSDVKIPISSGEISVAEVCNIVYDLDTEVTNLLSQVTNLSEFTSDIQTSLNSSKIDISNNSANITELQTKVAELKDNVDSLSELSDLDLSSFVKYDPNKDVSAHDYKFNAEGLKIVTDEVTESGDQTYKNYESVQSIYQVVSDILDIINTMYESTSKIEDALSKISTMQQTLSDLQTDFTNLYTDATEHIRNMSIHLNSAQAEYINKMLNPDLVFVVRDADGTTSS